MGTFLGKKWEWIGSGTVWFYTTTENLWFEFWLFLKYLWLYYHPIGLDLEMNLLVYDFEFWKTIFEDLWQFTRFHTKSFMFLNNRYDGIHMSYQKDLINPFPFVRIFPIFPFCHLLSHNRQMGMWENGKNKPFNFSQFRRFSQFPFSHGKKVTLRIEPLHMYS